MTSSASSQRSAAWQAYLDYCDRLPQKTQALILGHFEQVIANGIEARALQDPAGVIAALHGEMISLLNLSDLHLREAEFARVSMVYDEARRRTFPAYCAYVAQLHSLSGLTDNASLMAVQSEVLQDIDLKAHEDATFAKFVAEMAAMLNKVKSPPNATAYSQFFEIYAEALVLRFLRARGIETRRVADTISAPDFECQLESGKKFFVEVKALDIVGGEIRHNQIMADGLKPNLEIEQQIRSGKRVASGVGEIAPYQKAFDDGQYDSRSLKRVIDSIRGKCRQAFKASQFERGPTFALIVADRLIVHGWSSALVPYYYDAKFSASVSGVLWHTAFGTVGAPVLRIPNFEGAPSVEGHLDEAGLYVDAELPFPGHGLVVLQRTSSRRVSYGLKAPSEDSERWSDVDTDDALHAMCDAWNDQENSEGYDLGLFKVEL